jgi:hypothetical protein
MKNIYKTLFIGLLCHIVPFLNAQTLDGFTYRTVVYDGNVVMANTWVDVVVAIYNKNNHKIYEEYHAGVTNEKGVLEIQIGNPFNVLSGDFDAIDWEEQGYTVNVKIKRDNESVFSDHGTFTFRYVPYVKVADRGGDTHRLDQLNEVNADESNLYISTTGDTGLQDTGDNKNTAVGFDALLNNTTGSYNTAIGYKSMDTISVQHKNTAAGYLSMQSILGNNSVAYGDYALKHYSINQSIAQNIDNNVAVGSRAMYYIENTKNNVAVGYHAFIQPINHNNAQQNFYNVAIGSYAFQRESNTSTYIYPEGATIVGDSVLAYVNWIDQYRLGYTAIGVNAIKTIAYETLSSPTIVGYGEYRGIDSNGSVDKFFPYEGVIIGSLSGDTISTGTTVIGYNSFRTKMGSNDLYNTVIASNYEKFSGYNHETNIFGNSNTTSIGGYAVWNVFSDGRFKYAIKENVPGLEFVNKLRPVTFYLDRRAIVEHSVGKEYASVIHKPETVRERQIGFLAQEVEQAAKEMNFDFSAVSVPDHPEGIYTIKYAEFVPVLVKAVQELIEQTEALKTETSMNEEKIKELQDLVEELKTQIELRESEINNK